MTTPMIHLKIKKNHKMVVPEEQPIDPLTSQLKSHIEKVTESLRNTQLKSDLVIPVELAIRHKTIKDVDNLKNAHDFETYRTIYLTNARHIIANLKNNNQINNLTLIEKVNQGSITPDVLVDLNPQDMFTERWHTLIEKKLHDINNLTKDPEATTDLYQCARCKRNKCTYFQRQDRSADEPMTIHITCCYCGKKWRQ